MGQSNTLLYVVLAIVILHFIIGFGFLAWKLLGPIKKTDLKNKEGDEGHIHEKEGEGKLVKNK